MLVFSINHGLNLRPRPFIYYIGLLPAVNFTAGSGNWNWRNCSVLKIDNCKMINSEWHFGTLQYQDGHKLIRRRIDRPWHLAILKTFSQELRCT